MLTKLSNWKSRILKKKWYITWWRINQVKSIIDNGNRISDLENFEETEIPKIIEENRELAIQAIMEDITVNQSKNKALKKQLEVYLKSFISNLNKEEVIGIYSKLEYYRDIYKVYSLANKELVELLDLELEIDSLYNILYNFLIKGVLLPEVKTQQEFSNSLNSIIFNLEQSLETESQNKPFALDPINPSEVLSAMINENNYTPFWNIDLNSDLIDNFSYSFSLNSIDPEIDEEEDKIDDVSFTFWFYKVWDIWIDRKRLIKGLNSMWITEEIEPSIYYVWSTQKVKVLLELSRRSISETSDWEAKERFSFTIYTEDISNQKAWDFLDNSLYALTKYTDQLINDLYRFTWYYQSVQDRIVIDYDSIAWEDAWTKEEALINKWAGKSDKELDATVESLKWLDWNLDNLILEKWVKQQLQQLVKLFVKSEFFSEKWVDLPKWTILYGPSWTWKTLCAKTLSKIIDAEFVLITHDQIENKWVWWSEKNIKKVFDDRRKRFKKTWKKQIIYLEEGDSLFEARSDERNNKEWIVSIVLWEMDWFDSDSLNNIFVLISTNRIEAIDSAIKRRFDNHLYFGLPNFKNRVKHFKLNIDIEEKKSWEQVFSNDLDFDLLAKKTDNKSGAFIATLMKNAKRDYFDKMSDWLDVKFLTTKQILKNIKYLEIQEENRDKVMWFIAN